MDHQKLVNNLYAVAMDGVSPLDRFADLQKQGFMKQGRNTKKQKFWQHWLPNGEGVTYEGTNENEAKRLLAKYGGEIKSAVK
jgi:hypothetical protein